MTRGVRDVLEVLGRRLRARLGRDRIARDVEEEMRLHLELRQRRLEGQGLRADAAYTAARRRFGNAAVLREDAVDAWGWRWLDDLGRDARFALRGFARHPGFAATAIVSLALGIGANAAIFSVVDGLILKPLPFTDPDRLVAIYGTSRLMPRRDNVSNLDEVRRLSTSFDAMAGYDVDARYMRRDGGSERVMVVRAERDFFPLLGVVPLVGRTFDARDEDAVAVLSESFWRRACGADPTIVGRTIVLDDRSLTVVGVMPDGFQFPYASGSLLPAAAMQARTDVWQPLEHALTVRGRFSHVLARLRPGVTRAAAAAELAALAPRVQPAANLALVGPRGYELVPLAEDVVGAAVSRPLFMLLAAVGVVLALACANVANLLLVRVTRRHRELAVRAGLGASPARLVRQLLAESLLLSLSGGAVGLVLAWTATRRLLAAAAARVPRAPDVALDWRVFAFLFVLALLVGVIVGLAPALIALRKDARALHAGDGRATMSGAQRRLRDALVVAEVALAFGLAVGASLLVRELLRLRATDLGMRTDNVVTLHLGRRVPFSRTGAGDSDVRRYYDVEARVAALPGVEAAGLTQMLPLQSWGWFSNSVDFFEKGRPPRQPVFPIELRFVTPGYFRALGITLRRGRGFGDADTRGTPTVLVINEALARAQFGDGDPLGRQMNRGVIVGVIADVRGVHPDRPAQPEAYYAVAQNWSQVPDLGMTLVVRAGGAPAAIVDRVRSAVHDVDPLLAVFEVKTMEQVVDDSLSLFRLFLSLIAAFAGVAVVLALTGTYGVVSYVSASRVREFALRMALGAGPSRLAGSVLGQGVRLTTLGLGVGAALVAAGAPLLHDLPVTVRPPSALIVVPLAVALGAVTLLACLLPAVRAARVDPMAALRAE